jgi:hypothetical protein
MNMPGKRKRPPIPKPDSSIRVGNVIASADIVVGASVTATVREDAASLRAWWHNILRTYGRYSTYAIFLTLPSDKETLRYLTDYGKELNLISGRNCLVIVLSKTMYKDLTIFDESYWRELAEEHTSEGHSINVARRFDIDFTQFPCLLVFQDIRSPEHIAIGLTGMTTEEIATRMRLVFAIIEIAVKDKNNPLLELERQHYVEVLNKTGQTIAGKVGSFAEKTFEAAMEAWMKAAIK